MFLKVGSAIGLCEEYFEVVDALAAKETRKPNRA